MTREIRRIPAAVCRLLICLAVVAAQTGAWSTSGTPARDPFEFFAPSVVVSSAERASLDRNQALTRPLAGPKGQLGVFVATRLNAHPDAITAWTRAIVELKRGKFVLAIGRFSDPPQVSDLDALALDDRDLESIRRCRPGACALKLSAAEIRTLSAAAARTPDDWRVGVQQEFRRLLVERVLQYQAAGLAEAPVPADRTGAPHPQHALSAIVDASPYLTSIPEARRWLLLYPRADASVESFFYWSKEHYGEGKPVISVTHVGIVRSRADHRLPTVLVLGKQILATHYIEGGLGLTTIVRDSTTGTAYLAYLNRSQVDFLRGWFGGLMRGMLEDRLEREAPLIVRSLRERLESGAPSEAP